MPIININGAPPGGGRGGRGGRGQGLPDNISFVPGLKPFPFKGPRADIPYMRPELQQGFAANEAAKKAAERRNADYDRAVRQQAAQIRADAAAERRRRQETDRAFRQQQQDQARINRENQRQAREEIRLNERRLQLEARRYRFQQSLGVNITGLQMRASRAFTPSTYRAVMARSNTIRSQLNQFTDQFGLAAAPFRQGAITDLQNSMGSFENTYRTQNVLRLGNMGGRAANERSWVELVRIEKELNKIYKQAEATAKNTGSTAKQKVDAQRIIDAVGVARQQIAAGRSGTSGLMNFAGTQLGGLGLMLRNPWVALAGGAALTAVTAPVTIGGLASLFAGMARPHMNLRRGLAELGRGGDFNSQDLENLIFTGGNPPDWMRTYGLGAADINETLHNLGIRQRTPGQNVGVIQSLLRAQYSPFNTLSQQQLTGYANVLGTLGIALPGAYSTSAMVNGTEAGGGAAGGLNYFTNFDRYFRKLGEVQAAATSMGIDHSAVMRTQLQLLQSTSAAGGASVPHQGLADWLIRQMGGGTPGLRSGVTEMSAIQGFNSSVSNIGVGGSPTMNVALMSFFRRNGGMPKSQEDLRKLLGMGKDEFDQMMSQPANAQAWKDYQSSPNDMYKLNYLSQFLVGHPELAQKIVKGSVFGELPGYTQALVQQNLFNQPLTSVEAERSGMGAMAYFGNLLQAESGGQQYDKNGKVKISSKGAIGAGQMMPATARQAAALAGVPYDENRLRTDREYNLLLSRTWLEHLSQKYPTNPAAAIAAYNAGEVRVDEALKKGGAQGFLAYTPQETQGYVQKIMGGGPLMGANFPYDQNRIESDVKALQMTGAQYVENFIKSMGPMDQAVGSFVNVITKGASEVEQAIKYLATAVGKVSSILDRIGGNNSGKGVSMTPPSSSFGGYGTPAPARP